MGVAGHIAWANALTAIVACLCLATCTVSANDRRNHEIDAKAKTACEARGQ